MAPKTYIYLKAFLFPRVPRPSMRLLSLVTACSFVAVSLQQNVDSYVQSETPIAKAGVLANIGPNGSKSSGAAPGVVIASPSTTNPDYLFTWTRDSSLVRTHQFTKTSTLMYWRPTFRCSKH